MRRIDLSRLLQNIVDDELPQVLRPRLDPVGSFRGASPNHTLLSNIQGGDDLYSRNDCLRIIRRAHDRALRARSNAPGEQ